MMNISLISALILGISLTVGKSDRSADESMLAKAPPFVVEQNVEWADSVVAEMSLDEKIAQLFMVAAYSNKDKKEEDYINYLVKDLKIGGLIFMQGGPERQSRLINRYQASADIPLLIAMDAEWGPSMRLDSTVLYPRQMMLGAIQENQLMQDVGAEFARQLKALGVHVNFAPVVDINVNPQNPVINSRAYGELRDDVVRKAYYFSKGMQYNKVLAVIKHFPGHGDTDKDSHKTLPSILHDKARLDSIEMYPFRKLVNAGIGGVMIAHLNVPALDSAENRPSTLSKAIVTDILKDEYGFDGLIFTDALNMRGVADHYDTGEVEVEAFIAGNDVLLFPQNVPKAISAMKAAVADGRIAEIEIDARVKKILFAKQWTGAINDSIPINPKGLVESLNNTNAKLINQKIIENAMSLIQNKNDILPLQNLDKLNIASLDFGSNEINTFQERLKDYASVPAYVYKRDVRNLGKKALMEKLAEYDLLILSVTGTNRSPARNFGLSAVEVEVIQELAKSNKVVLNHFGNPYALSLFFDVSDIDAIIVSYNDRILTQDISAQMIFGGLAYNGRIPVSIGAHFAAGSGITTKSIRLSYTDITEEVNIDSRLLYKVDSLVKEAIDEKATPGVQLLAARHGKVFFRKAYGHHTYDKKQAVMNSDIYDLASVTKIAASTLSLMKLYDEEKWQLNDSLGNFLDFLKGSNKANLQFKDVLTHQARLVPWIPFYTETIKENYGKYYCEAPNEQMFVPVADHMFTMLSVRDSINYQISKSKLRSRNGYRYSDLGFYLMREIIEKITEIPIEVYVQNQFYKPLGAYSLGYNPSKRFAKTDIVPTENDRIFRKQLLRGHVHDQGAAMLGGVSGHAGLFSNANDLAKLMQMFLNKGSYGGERFINKETVQLFSSPLRNPKENRRGLGFDRPVIDSPGKGPACDFASKESFGHSGFTGILAWVDPETDILFVFMSNRVYPDMDNRKLLKLDTRTKVQQVFYDAIMD
ncbi:MAG: glycoside hydrolase family 3 N-terminal domain-containing protein [Bacteroidota bacterium]|nr:glycoside hydrolase family 3 N-terminal domain-containing protein [Bacteroidota bacterium]